MIPSNDILVTPKKIHKFIEELFNNIISDYSYNEGYEKIILKIKKEFLNELKKTFVWQKKFLSYKACEHIYGEYSKDFGKFCNKRIDINTPGYLCAKHIEIKHEENIKKRNIPNEKLCKGFKTRKNTPCRKEGKYDGFCYHHFSENKIEKLENKNESLPVKPFAQQIQDIIRNSVNTESIYNILENVKNKNNINKDDKIHVPKNLYTFSSQNNLELEKTIKKKNKYYIEEIEKNNNIYYLCNRIKRRKNNCKTDKIENTFIDYKFSFKYSIKDYYINNIKKNNKNKLNDILIYIIDIRNCIYNDINYTNNNIYMNIINISDKILEII